MLQQDCLKKYYALPYCYLRIDRFLEIKKERYYDCLTVSKFMMSENGEPKIVRIARSIEDLLFNLEFMRNRKANIVEIKFCPFCGKKLGS